jgi:hypothetical protein
MNNKKIELLQKLRQQLLDDLKEINELIYDLQLEKYDNNK